MDWNFVTYLTRGHHHAATDGVKGVRGNTGTSGDRPTEEERGEEVALKGTDEEDRLDGVVHAEVETAVDDDTSDGGHETTVETGNTVGGHGLAVDVNQTVELTVTARLGVLGVVGKTSTGVVEGVDEEEGGGTGSTARGKVAGHPPPVAVTLLLESEHGLVGVAESEVQGLGGEVTDNVGGVAAPQRGGTLRGHGALEALANAGVGLVEAAGAEHLILVLDEELDTLDGGGGSLGDGGGNTTHYRRVSDCFLLGVFPAFLFRRRSRALSLDGNQERSCCARRVWMKRTQEVDDEARHAHLYSLSA